MPYVNLTDKALRMVRAASVLPIDERVDQEVDRMVEAAFAAKSVKPLQRKRQALQRKRN